MSSTAPAEFLFFPQLPPELREMVWNEALPNLDMQRFNAEIASHSDSPKSNKPEDLVLCLTPNDDFVQLTSGYVGLLGACRESRWAAIAGIKCYLPINYIARDTDGSVAVRFAKVPFNPDGNVCISGLGLAFHNAAEGNGARGTNLPSSYLPHALGEGIQCVTFPGIKNLTITLNMPGDFESIHFLLMGWNKCVFDNMVKRMNKLETVAMVDEDRMNERHQIEAKDFEWLHNPMRVVRPREDDDGWDYGQDEPSTVEIPWQQLFHDFAYKVDIFKALMEFRAGRIAAAAR